MLSVFVALLVLANASFGAIIYGLDDHYVPSRVAHFGPVLNETTAITGIMVVAGAPPSTISNETKGCQAYSASNQLNNRIVLVERGVCPFVQKVYIAQLAGAKAVVVYNSNLNEQLISMQGDQDLDYYYDIDIPSFFISREDGLALKSLYLSLYNATGNGIYVMLNVSLSEYQDFSFSVKQYSILGIVLGVFAGISAMYWIGFYLWRRIQRQKRTRAVRKLKRAKYAKQLLPDLVGETAARTSREVEADCQAAAETAPNTSSVQSEEAAVDVESGVTTHTGEDLIDENHTNVVEKSPGLRNTSPWPLSGIRNKLRKPKAAENKPLYDTGACTVCLDDFAEGEEILILPCRHIFHSNCVQDWLEQQGQCPFCKTSVIADGAVVSNDEYTRRGFGYFFGNPLPQTLIFWFVLLCLAIVLGYFLVAAGIGI